MRTVASSGMLLWSSAIVSIGSGAMRAVKVCVVACVDRQATGASMRRLSTAKPATLVALVIEVIGTGVTTIEGCTITAAGVVTCAALTGVRLEEHTYELTSLMRIS